MIKFIFFLNNLKPPNILDTSIPFFEINRSLEKKKKVKILEIEM